MTTRAAVSRRRHCPIGFGLAIYIVKFTHERNDQQRKEDSGNAIHDKTSSLDRWHAPNAESIRPARETPLCSKIGGWAGSREGGKIALGGFYWAGPTLPPAQQ